ncbi:hypothetical protein L195_g054333, partial [Trifolium pratense]
AARNFKLEGHMAKMESELIDLRGKQENYGNLLEEARQTREDLEKVSKELEELKAQGAEEKRKLEEEIADLKGKVAPVADETEDTLRFATRADLVKEIRRLGGKMVESMVYCWKNVKAQLKIVNAERGLVTEGIHKLKKVEKGQIVIPEKYRQWLWRKRSRMKMMRRMKMARRRKSRRRRVPTGTKKAMMKAIDPPRRTIWACVPLFCNFLSVSFYNNFWGPACPVL